MSEIKYTVCDRCGERFEYSRSKMAGWFKHGIKKKNFIHFHELGYGGGNGYDYSDYKYELCGKCTEQLIDFLHMKNNK